MLKDDLYTIIEIEKEADSFKASLQLNIQHKIFNAHFPGNPILPGACMLQMLKEILEVILEKKLQLLTAQQIKFLAVINPAENKILEVEVKIISNQNNYITIYAKFSMKTIMCFKFSGIFTLNS